MSPGKKNESVSSYVSVAYVAEGTPLIIVWMVG